MTPVKNPKGKANKFPESWDEFSEGDKLIVNLRKEGKKWDEVEKAWINVTGEVPGKDVLRKREAKLRAVAVEFKAGDVSSPSLSIIFLCAWLDLLLMCS